MKKPDLLLALRPVVDAFDRLSIPSYIGGSLASSAYDMHRAWRCAVTASVESVRE